jgi:hypothetical protein
VEPREGGPGVAACGSRAAVVGGSLRVRQRWVAEQGRVWGTGDAA